MKKLFFLIFLLSSVLGTYAQLSKTINLATAGTLSTALTPSELQNVSKLTITGNIDARDFKTMRNSMPVLSNVDISSVTVAAYEGWEGTYHLGALYRANAIPQYAFHLNYRLTSIVLPLSVISIEHDAFQSCTKLTTVTLPSSGTSALNSIGNSAFYGCQGLNTINIPSSVAFIGEEAFKGCVALTSVTIPSSLTRIGGLTFCACIGLTSISIPSSVRSIERDAFLNCSGLISATLGSSVASIGIGAFEGCNKLTITVVEDNPNFSSLDGVLYNKAKTNLIKSPINKTGSFNIPSTVTSIENSAFEGCSGLTNVVIPSTVTSIGGLAFYGCRGLTSVSIPSSLTSISYGTFWYCTELASVSIPSSVTLIESDAFSACKKLSAISIPASVDSIGYDVFSGCGSLIVDSANTKYSSLDGVLYNKPQTNLIHYPVSRKGSFIIPSTVTSIERDAFNICRDLSSVTIPFSVNSIGYHTFSGCSGLSVITALNPKAVIFHENNYAFNGVNKNTCILNVPYGSKYDYQSNWDWYDFKSIVEMSGFKLSASTASVKETQGSSATIDVSSNVTWTASSDQSWLSVSPTTGNGSNTLIITVTGNPNFSTRTATVKVTADGVEPQNITVTQDATTGIDPVDKNPDFAIYPNPTSGKLKIEFDQNMPKATFLEVFDVAGNLILKRIIQDQEIWIDLKGMAPGVYLIKTNLKGYSIQKVILR